MSTEIRRETQLDIPESTRKWADIWVKLAWIAMIGGVILGGIFWVAIGGVVGEDLGALTWVLGFSGAIAAFSIRQAILEERV